MSVTAATRATTAYDQTKRYIITITPAGAYWRVTVTSPFSGATLKAITRDFPYEEEARIYANTLWHTGGVACATAAISESVRFNREWVGFKDAYARREAEQERAAYEAKSSCENYDGECIHYGGTAVH